MSRWLWQEEQCSRRQSKKTNRANRLVSSINVLMEACHMSFLLIEKTAVSRSGAMTISNPRKKVDE